MPSLFSLADFRQTLRRLVRERGFTATVLLTLALCIGANVAIFAVVDAVLVRSLPFAGSDRLVTMINSYPGAGVERAGASLPNYYDRRAAIKAFSSSALVNDSSAIVGEAGAPDRVVTARVTADFFATLGVPLALGRAFTEDEMMTGHGDVAILTDAFWRKTFDADPKVVGRTFQADARTMTVVGVLPPGFHYLSSHAQYYVPVTSKPEDRGAKQRHSNNFQLIARLAPGATLADARAQLDAFNLQQLTDDPYANLVKGVHFHTVVSSLHDDHVREIRPILLLLQAGVLFLLLIGGVNLINLLLVRASGRAKELAVRQALGAGRGHVAREVLLETVLLATVGGVLGLVVGAVGIRLLAVLGTDRLPLGAEIVFDGRVALIAFAVSVLVGVVLALPIIWFNLHGQLAPVLQAETRGGTVSRAAQRMRHGFIIAQVALAFVLLTGAGMLGLSLQRILATDPGFQPEHVLTGQISQPSKTYGRGETGETEQRLPFFERLLGELRAQPGVTAVGLVTALPLTNSVSNNATSIEGVAPAPDDPIRAHYTSGVIGDYAGALGLRLLEGRFLGDDDNHGKQQVCVVDADFARRYWPGKSALGHRIVNGPTFNEKDAHTIVGVVAPVKQTELAETNAQGAIYYPYKSYSSSEMTVVLRTAQPPEALAPLLRKIVLRLDPQLPVDELKPMQAWIDESLVPRRSPAILAAIFAGVVLLLAAIGTYGVLAYAVSQRRREIGVRMALGALPRQVLAQFLGLGAKLLLAGTALGVLGAWAAGRAMQSVLFGVGVVNVGVLVGAAAVMVAVVLLATFLPSHRASRVSPMEALRDVSR